LRNGILLGGPLLASLMIAQITLSGLSPTRVSGYSSPSNIDLLTPAFICVLVILGIFYVFRRRGEQAVRFVVAGITVVGVVSGLVLLQLSFPPGTLPVLLYLPAAPLAYLGLYWSFRSYTGTLSPKKTLILTIVSITLLGTLVGILFPLSFTLPFLISLSILDTLIVESNFLRRALNLTSFDDVISATTLPLADFEIGLGDLLVYSMLSAGSLRGMGIYIGAVTAVFILAGAFVTFRITRSRLRFPGLPIPVGLGAVPSIIVLMIG